MKLDDGLRGVTRLGIDTAPVIYFVEAHPTYDTLVTEIFRRIGSGAFRGITSVITLGEALVRPLTNADLPLQEAYRDLLLLDRRLQTVGIDAVHADRAAQLRAHYRLRMIVRSRSPWRWVPAARRS
jgi:hypothetical protein